MPGSDDEFENPSDDESSVEDSDKEQDEEQEEIEEEKEEEPEEEPEEEEEEPEEDEPVDLDDEDDDSESDIAGSLAKKSTSSGQMIGGSMEDDDDDDEEINETYLQKFNSDINKQYLVDFHPEAMIHNYDEINALTTVVRDEQNNIIDKLHRTLPYLTKYERARVLGQRAKQINSGAKSFVKIPENVIDGYLIAELELSQKRVPFIIRRPIPGGACEYWKLRDLEIIGF